MHISFATVFTALFVILATAAVVFAQTYPQVGHAPPQLNLTPIHIDTTNLRVGVGTATPFSTFHINGTLNVTGNVQFGPSSFHYDPVTDILSVGGLKLTGPGGPISCNLVAAADGSFQCGSAGFWSQIGTNIFYNTGNVGIGTATPNSLLSVTETTPATNAIINISSPAAQWSAIDFYDRGTSVWGIGKDGSNNFYIGEPGNDRLTILQGGNVGIGTTNIGANNKLHVDGGSAGFSIGIFGESAGMLGYGVFGNSTGLGAGVGGRSDNYIGVEGISDSSAGVSGFSNTGIGGYFESTSGYGLIVGSGNVGIGTTDPQKPLHIRADGSAAGGYKASIKLESSASENLVDTYSYLSLSTPRYHHLNGPAFTRDNAPFEMGLKTKAGAGPSVSDRWYVGRSGIGAKDLVVNKDGNVGIGTITPNYDLEVVGNIHATGDITCDGSCGGGGGGGAFTDVGPGTYAYYTGDVSIGKSTAATEALDVTGNIVASGTICDSTGCISGGAGGSQIMQAVGTTDISRTSTSFADMPDMTITMDTNGNDVALDFSATMRSAQMYGGYTRLMVDGVEKHRIAWENGNDAFVQSTGLHWIERNLAAGQHTFTLQWATQAAPTIYQDGSTYPRVFSAVELGGGGSNGFTPSDINSMGWGDDSNGEVTFPNGLQMKWGRAGASVWNIDFTNEGLTDFNNACFQVFLQAGNIGTHSNEHPDAVTSMSATGFTISHTTNHTPFSWFAIGR
jgi:hypothetical protein